MGRQFGYYCLSEDLAIIHDKVFAPLGGRLMWFDTTSTVGMPVSFAPTPDETDAQYHWALTLLPPAPMDILIFDGQHLDASNSNVIKVGRCSVNEDVISPGRFWFEPIAFVDYDFHKKSPEFVHWAMQVFARAKRRLLRETTLEKGPFSKYTYKDWYGPAAWRAVSSGQLTTDLVHRVKHNVIDAA
jgi:hypothetical protein